jgi:hypothetical protein
MKPILISSRAKTVNELLNKARRKTIILESADGQRFALTSIGDWEGYDVGRNADFAKEVEQTGKNKRLMSSLATRRKGGTTPAIPLADVKKQLGIE